MEQIFTHYTQEANGYWRQLFLPHFKEGVAAAPSKIIPQAAHHGSKRWHLLSLHTTPSVPCEVHELQERNSFCVAGKNTEGTQWRVLLNWPVNPHNLFFCPFLFYRFLSKLSPAAVTTHSPQAWTCLLTFTPPCLYGSLHPGPGSSQTKAETGSRGFMSA